MSKKVNPTLARIIHILNDGLYHDGDSIGQALQMTRSAIWKSIRKLMNYGVKVDSVKGKGYALLEPLILLDAEAIKKQIQHPQIELVLFESLVSTNDYLKAIKNTKRTSFCIAEQQTGGRGRLGREWYSPFGENIYLSCSYTFQKDISELAGLSMVTGLAMLAALNTVASDNLSVKWPNDIVCGGDKLAGCLIDIQAESHGVCQVVIGMGVNVNMLSDPSERINQGWTSLRKITGNYADRNEVCVSLINCLITHLQKFEAQGFAVFTDEWMKSDCLMKQDIVIQSANGVAAGTVVGINEYGHLMLRDQHGVVSAYSSGDTTLHNAAPSPACGRGMG